ncbi:MAG: hypothetical protein PHR11_02970 [Candidatus Omnitrophica bacterium]|nr:hypothetical protein [Candidatus Omnitrophota bacterium]
MQKKFLLLLCLCAFLFISGCETIKGAGVGAFNGAKKDWQSLKTADERFREALW